MEQSEQQTSQEPQTARIIIEVVAGLIPGKPEPEFTKRWAITSQQWAEARKAEGNAMVELMAETAGRAQGYAMVLMMQPDRLNWVRTDWIYL